MTQQTAIDLLYTKLSTCTSEELVGNVNKWFEEAKVMEKEQMIDFAEQWQKRQNESDMDSINDLYYKTYGK